MKKNNLQQFLSDDIWAGAALGLLIAVVATASLTLGEVFFGRWQLLVALLFFVLIAAFFVLPIWIITKIKSLLPPCFQWALLASIPVVSLPYMWADRKGAIIVGVCIAVMSSFCGASLWSLYRLRSKPLRGVHMFLTIAAATIGVTAAAVGTNWLFGSGHRIEEPINAATLRPEFIPPLLDLPDPSQAGDFEVNVVSYGSGKDTLRSEYGDKVDLTTESVDGSAFISGWEGITGTARTAYWGFDKSQLPLNGVVYSPIGAGRFPLVLIVHGNYLMQGRSDIAFTYLAELLASQGYIVVNVDECFLNLAWYDVFAGKGSPETSARGWMLLEHLRQWQNWSETPGNPFYSRVDMEQIALIGHSRGGEAVAVAAALNRLPYFPSDGRKKFDYNFNIRSVIALSPVDGQYKPTGRSTPLEDVNYLVLYGAFDGDVVSTRGFAQYARVRLTPGGNLFKSTLYIYGANHSNFTTVWINSEKPGPTDLLFNTSPLMSPEQQRQLAKTYVGAFLAVTLKNDQRYKPLFRDPRVGRRWLPDTIYLNQYQDSETQMVASFEEDVNLESAEMPHVTLTGLGLREWYENEVVMKHGPMGNNAVYLGWENSEGRYRITFGDRTPPLTASDSLTFSLAAAVDPRNSVAIDFTIALTDQNGNMAKLALSHFSYLQPPITAQYMKADILNSLPSSEVVFQTFSFPFADFTARNGALDLSEISRIELIFDKTPRGLIALDNLGFRRPSNTQGQSQQ